MPHVRFSDEDADVDMADVDEQAGAPNSLKKKAHRQTDSASSGHQATISSLHLARMLSVSSPSKDEADYVLDIAISPGERNMAASTSAWAVQLYSADGGAPLGELRGHVGPITGIQFLATASSPQTLASSSSDGTIRLWDLRSGSQVGVLHADPDDEMLGFSLGGSTGMLVAAGSNAKVQFWDWRTQRRMAVLEEAHTEDVVQVAFHPSHPEKLVSASVDGLICVFDTATKIDDEDSIETVMNAGTSVSRFGFYGESLEGLWCLTGIETLSLWRWEDGDSVADFPTARDTAAGLWPLASVDYFIRCVGGAGPEGAGLALLGGTNEGDVGCFPIFASPGEGNSRICPASAVLRGGHEGIVRTLELLPEFERSGIAGLEDGRGGREEAEGRLRCWTGGEDGRLCAWTAAAGGLGEIARRGVGESAMGAGGPVFSSRRSGLSSSRQRHSPY